MAKRFTDTEKWKKAWFRELGSKLRDLRQFILDDCDNAGIWEVDFNRAAYNIGQSVSEEEVRSAFKNEVFFLDDSKRMFIPAFIQFQYSDLSGSSNAVRSVVKKLSHYQIDLQKLEPFRNPSRRVLDKDKDMDMEMDKEKDKDKDKDNAKLTQDVKLCLEEYSTTLAYFKIPGSPSLRSETQIARLGARWGFQDLRLAIVGMRDEARSDKYNPADHVSIDRLGDEKNFEKFRNLGAKHEQDSAMDVSERIDTESLYRSLESARRHSNTEAASSDEFLRWLSSERTDAPVRGNGNGQDLSSGDIGL